MTITAPPETSAGVTASAPPLVIAAHGTRKRRDAQAVAAFTDQVRAQLPGVDVLDSYVELTDPPIATALAEALTRHGRAVVVPLMIGSGGHVREDIPEAIEAARAQAPGKVVYARHLGPDPRLRAQVLSLIDEAAGDWEPGSITVIMLGRGCSVTDANADHVRLGRVIAEEGRFGRVHDAFIQVTRPGLPQALDEAYRMGARRIVVVPHYLFPGALQRWTVEAVGEWAPAHPDAEVRVTGLLGEGAALAEVVADRYREAAATLAPGAPVYLSGLDLNGRRVLVAGAGGVAARRIPRLLAVGADVEVVSPVACPQVEHWAAAGQLRWTRREVVAGDADGAWYVVAGTDDPAVNAMLAAAAEERHTFCVRSDDASGGSAWTPATGSAGAMTVGVIGSRAPLAAAAARDAAVDAVVRLGDVLPDGTLG